MGSKNIHIEPFDNGTITKLEIFEDYAQAWIPTFVMQSKYPEIHIFDFFSGPGYDSINVPGSPIRILQKIEEQLGNILAKKTKIVLHLNEFEPNKKRQDKYDLLIENCNNFLENHPKFQYFLNVTYYNEDAEDLFFKLLPTIKKFPSLVYLDQNGIKFISKEYIEELDSLTTTDFLYFVSSSFFRRYGTTGEFKKVLTIDSRELESEEYRNMHRLVCSKIKSRLPQTSDLKLFPFSIKKNKNIYGIVFGAKSYAAVDKFLSISWKRNAINGEADFDIDEDKDKNQLMLFDGKKMTKIEKFQMELENRLLQKSTVSNKEILIYTYESGHIPKHSVEVIKKLKGQGKLAYNSRSPFLNYKNVFRENNIINYKIVK
ncbi:three-Cys-motif partner protein TcmP [Flavobacterium sp.]|uniref:three-Cys-motif partner protein TcmP n=1 Tax=Flavobacterium sp. TaxID=239 RepID=UPI0011FBF605|nr:three-Cys-motif partner protein TcmP [Flavobacterium sp.]RZJ69982.1 MAG: three-Cys-motif partner protein TcmP [Flavobacterium sp.]